MVYSWKYNMKVPAEKAGKEMERIERKHGEVTPENVLEESRAEGATLHNLFEWDDTVAAEKYRLNQAGLIIRNLTVTIETVETKPTMRAYVNVSDDTKGRFISITNAMSNEDTREIVLRNALAELKEFRKKYSDLQELSEVFSAIDKIA